MAFNIADEKVKARRRLHERAAVPALYRDDTFDDADPSVAVTVRWHNKIIPAGTINNDSEIITGIERLIFNQEELAVASVVLSRGGIVEIPLYDDMRFELGFEEPNDGPVTTAWSVSAI